MPSPDRPFTQVKLGESAIDLIDALPRMPGSGDLDSPVTVAIQAGNLVLRSRPRSSDEWAQISVPDVAVTGPDRRVCLNRTFITKGLRFGFTEFKVQDPLSPVLFTGPGKKMVAMPLRLDDAPASPQDHSQPAQPFSQQAATPAERPPTANRPPLVSANTTEQNTAMDTNNTTTLPAPERGNLKPTSTGSNGAPQPASKPWSSRWSESKPNSGTSSRT